MPSPQNSTVPPVIVRLDDRFFTRIFRIIIGLVAFYFLVKAIPLMSSAIFTLIIAVLLTAVFDPIISFLERKGINRLGAVTLLYVVLIFIFVLAIKFSGPIISDQISSLSSSIETQSPTGLIDNLQTKLAKKLPLLNNPQISKEITEKMDALMIGFMEKSFSMAVGLLSSFPNLIIIGFCVFFFLKDGWRIKRAIIQAMPNRYFEISLILVHKTTEQLGRYIRGQLIVAAAVGILSIIALTLLHVRYSFFIGAIAGLANMIPYFGPIAGAIPAIVIGFMDTGSFGIVLAIAGAFATVQLTENIFISPYVVAKSVELHPLAIIVVILIGGSLLGLWGLLLAVPVASIIKVMFMEIKWGMENYKFKDRLNFQESLPE
ncbi:MAG: AI-2E family transporter [Calditrichaeota bacterium]|nr:MAG: AI-2E family transporter [Calditrichota bacterium]